MGTLHRDYGPAWPWAWGIREGIAQGDDGMLVERWWFHGEEGQSRLNTKLLAQVMRHPEFAELHGEATTLPAWPPSELRLEPPTANRQLARLVS
jgi:hypothetical protein